SCRDRQAGRSASSELHHGAPTQWSQATSCRPARREARRASVPAALPRGPAGSREPGSPCRRLPASRCSPLQQTPTPAWLPWLELAVEAECCGNDLPEPWSCSGESWPTSGPAHLKVPTTKPGNWFGFPRGLLEPVGRELRPAFGSTP